MVHLKTAYGPPVGHDLGAGLKGRGPGKSFSVGPYDLIDDVIVCKNCFADSQRSRLSFPVVENVLTQLRIPLVARREFMI